MWYIHEVHINFLTSLELYVEIMRSVFSFFSLCKLLTLYWSTEDYQCCGGFRWTAKGLRQVCIHSWAALVVKHPPGTAGGVIPGSGRSPGGGHGNPLQGSCLENPVNRGSWWATVHSVTKNWTGLKRLSSSSILPETPLPCRLPQNWAEFCVLYTVGPYWLSMLNIAVCICLFQTH